MRRLFLLLFIALFCVSVRGQVNSQRVVWTASNPPTSCVPGKVVTNPSLSPAKAWVGTSAGACTEIDASAAAPANATYIVEIANSTLTNEFALASLATGILKNTTTTGVPSIAVAGDFPTLNQNTTGTAANLSGTPALPNGTTATTQSQADNSTKLATTAYIDTGLGGKLNLAGGTLTGNLLFTDNTLDIGASGATRPRTGYFGTSIISPLVNGLTITNNGTNTLNIATGQTLTVTTGGTLGSGAFISSTAGGDLSGTLPSPTVVKINGVTLGTTTATSGNILIGSGSQWGTQSISGSGATITLGNTGVVTISGIPSATLNLTTTTCTNQFVTAISSGGVGTCTTDTLASAQHANQGTTTTVLHGNAAGNPSFGAVSLTADVSGVLPTANIAVALANQTSINGLGITASTGTLTITNAKILTILKTMSLTAADDTGVYTLPTGTKTLLATDGAGTSLTGIPYTLTGTANQVVLSAGTGNITFSLPQSIATASTPQFAKLGLGRAADASTGVIYVGTTASGTQYGADIEVTGAATSNVGVYAAASGATNNTALVVAGPSAGTGQISISQTGTAANNFAGSMVMNSTAFVSTNLTNAAGTPGSVCYNTSTFELTKNNALTCTVSSLLFKLPDYVLLEDVKAFNKLRPVEFSYRDQPNRKRWGFIAEEVAAADLRLADAYDETGRPRSLDQNAILALTVKEVQRLKAEIETMKGKQ